MEKPKSEKPKPSILLPAKVLAERQRIHEFEAAHRYAREMQYARRRHEFRFLLRSGVRVTIPVANIPYFDGLTKAQLGRVKLDNVGGAIELREVDLDLSVPGIIRDAFGFGEIQQSRAGRVKSPKKAAAARANGAKGGRPRKKAA
jgi:hypothetical protein